MLKIISLREKSILTIIPIVKWLNIFIDVRLYLFNNILINLHEFYHKIRILINNLHSLFYIFPLIITCVLFKVYCAKISHSLLNYCTWTNASVFLFCCRRVFYICAPITSKLVTCSLVNSFTSIIYCSSWWVIYL